MFLSVFDIFKIGVGPSSSHTMGPMVAAGHFLSQLKNLAKAETLHITCTLYGSLALTGKGHATDRAVSLGLLGYLPDTIDPDLIDKKITALSNTKVLLHPDLPKLNYDPEHDLIYDFGPPLPGHPNGLIFKAESQSGQIEFEQTYYSIGGGSISLAEDLMKGSNSSLSDEASTVNTTPAPYPFDSAIKMLALSEQHQKSIADMKFANECTTKSEQEVQQGIHNIWHAMNTCIDRGLSQEGALPGGLNVMRRAKLIREKLDQNSRLNSNQPHVANDWLAVYAMAVNEENAAGGKVVTAPTNGAAGVVPAVLRYYLNHCVGATEANIPTFLLTAAAIGGLIKHRASISGAEVGCQGEVGSASSMAAAGLCAALGGTSAQIENAAEIALEHHLGMTCDPVNGLVQVPCIERNGLGAIKAVSAASLALHGDGKHFMPLDNCIEAMRQTGIAMNENFKETSLGGLAVNLPAC